MKATNSCSPTCCTPWLFIRVAFGDDEWKSYSEHDRSPSSRRSLGLKADDG